MKHVVITGGTRGIGHGLAEAFVKAGCCVTFSGTTDHSVTSSYGKFDPELDPARFKGVVCDVTNKPDIEMFWEFATSLFGRIDIWINNAGISNSQAPITDINKSEIDRLIDTNIKGLVYCCQHAATGMRKNGGGHIYNMGGLGSNGRSVEGLIPYGMSKRAVQYFTRHLAKELKGTGVNVSLLLPGMVITDMLLDPIRKDPEASRRARRIFNILGEEVESVSAFLVERILANEKTGNTISYLTTPKILYRFLSAPFNRRDLISDKL